MLLLTRCAVVGVILTVSAQAAIYSGNPHVTLTVQDSAGALTGGAAELDHVVLHHCAGGQTRYDVIQAIDPIEGYRIGIDPGNHCGLSLVWGGVVFLSGSGFSIEHSRVATYVELVGSSQSADLMPYTVTGGSYTNIPALTVDIQ